MHKHPATGKATMTLVKGIQHRLQGGRHSKGMLLKPSCYRLQGVVLISFHGDHIVGLLVANRLGDSFLTAYCVDGDQPTRECQTCEQSGNGGDLIGFAIHRLLP